MQFELHGSRFFVAALIAVSGILVASWLALNGIDQTLAAARVFVKSDPAIAAKIGTVEDTTLYKLRYLSQSAAPNDCFAEYFLLAAGRKGGRIAIRVRACGDRTAPTFTWDER